MKLWGLVLLVVFGSLLVKADNRHQHGAEVEDNEFAEFDFDDEEEAAGGGQEIDQEPLVTEEQAQAEKDEEDAVVETEEDEFDTLDPDEFEGLPGDDTIWENENKKTKPKNRKSSEPELTIAKVPLHLRSWDKYYLEILMGVGLSIYFINFFIGKTKNNSIASAWLKSHMDFVSSQFELVGDDPNNKTAESTKQLVKESEHSYTLWCSGRSCCEGMLVEIKLLKRQDLISVISNRLKPANDQVIITLTLTNMDPFVFCIGNKRAVTNLHKTMQDVNYFCTEKSKSGDKYGMSPNLFVLSELYGELPAAILDTKVKQVLSNNESAFDSLHISDQYSGLIPVDQDEEVGKIPETKKTIVLKLNLPSGGKNLSNIAELLPLLKITVYLMDRVRKFRLSRENKAKADKHRQDVLAKYMKQTHAQRQEAAQLKKEEKARALKDKMMNEEDPEKQRRMDEQIHRREMNKKNKKMMKGRQFKVKAM